MIDEIRPRYIVAMHLATPEAPPSWFGSAGSLLGRVEAIRRAFQRVWIPIEPLASRRYLPPHRSAG